MRTGEPGHLGCDLQQVEVLAPHLQEDLALRIEFQGFFERLVHVGLVFMVVPIFLLIFMFVHGIFLS